MAQRNAIILWESLIETLYVRINRFIDYRIQFIMYISETSLPDSEIRFMIVLGVGAAGFEDRSRGRDGGTATPSAKLRRGITRHARLQGEFLARRCVGHCIGSWSHSDVAVNRDVKNNILWRSLLQNML